MFFARNPRNRLSLNHTNIDLPWQFAYNLHLIDLWKPLQTLTHAPQVYTENVFTFVQIGAPTRSHIQRYADFQRDVEDEAQRINDRFRNGRWRPIVMLSRQHSHAEVQRYYRAAHLCMVTSLHDGMNLVAKEYIAARDDEHGVLILSSFTGAARDLRDAIIVNPYDVDGTANAIARALEMSSGEVSDRMRSMRRAVTEHNIYWWAGSLIGDLCDLRLNRV